MLLICLKFKQKTGLHAYLSLAASVRGEKLNLEDHFYYFKCCKCCVSSSTSINKHWEAELAALKGNNAKLTAALLESTANVKQWKQQLAAYQEEAERLHKRVALRHRAPFYQFHQFHQFWIQAAGFCVAGDGAGVRERPNDGNQISENRTQQDNRGAGVGSKGQRGGTRNKRDESMCKNTFYLGVLDTCDLTSRSWRS